MTANELHPAEEGAPVTPGVRATATFTVAEGVETTADFMCSDAGDFHTVTMASPAGDTRLVLAGSRHDLAKALRAALAALDART